MSHRSLFACCLAVVLFSESAAFAQKPEKAKSPRSQDTAVVRRNWDLKDPELANVLRQLAREARINLLIEDLALKILAGAAEIYLVDTTAFDALRVIVQTRGMLFVKKDSVYYVTVPAYMAEQWRKEHPNSDLVTRAWVEQTERILAWEAKPETAEQFAKARKALLDALLKEGFSREEAVRIVERQVTVTPSLGSMR